MCITDADITESAQAVAAMKTAADLDARMGVLKDRATMEGGNLAAFLVPVPEGYAPVEVAVFKRLITEAIEGAVKDAASQVAYDRTWGDK